MEQDRAPDVFLHQPQLAGTTADQLPNSREPHRRNSYEPRPPHQGQTGSAEVCERNPYHQRTDEECEPKTSQNSPTVELHHFLTMIFGIIDHSKGKSYCLKTPNPTWQPPWPEFPSRSRYQESSGRDLGCG